MNSAFPKSRIPSLRTGVANESMACSQRIHQRRSISQSCDLNSFVEIVKATSHFSIASFCGVSIARRA
jgi:hypothetical protein